MHPLKAPASDRYLVFFYKNCWNIIGGQVSSEVLNFIIKEELQLTLNQTYITLILKVNILQGVSE